MANCPCLCPELDCGPILTCINDDLIVIQVGEDTPALQNFCGAVIACVDAQFERIANGESSSFNFYGASIVKILQSFSGYSESGDFYLKSEDGDLTWVSSATIGQTYVDDGDGINVTGTGSSGDPYTPNIITSYVRGLFSAGSGITYNSGTGVFSASATPSTMWSLLGNSGTNSSTNFLGTTDYQALAFRVNDVPSAWLAPLSVNPYLDGIYISNIFIGPNAGKLARGTEKANIAIGTNAFSSYANMVSGTGANVAIGAEALRDYIGTGSEANTAIGFRALARTTTGFRNTAVGLNAGHNNTTALFGTFIGAFAGEWQSTGQANQALGFGCLRNNTIGIANTAVGPVALEMQSGQIHSITVTNGGTGYTTATVTISGYDANPFGFLGNAQNATAVAVINAGVITAINIVNVGRNYTSATVQIDGDGAGATAVANISSPNFNTAVGGNAGWQNQIGSDNVFIGVQSGYDGGGNKSSTIDNRMTFLGAYSSRDISIPTSTALTNATAIGYKAKVAKSNAIVLGATGADQVDVGIGTISPDTNLHVVGDLKFVTGNQGAGKVLTSDASGNADWATLSIPGAYTDEEAQDAVGTILTDSATVDFTYNDGVPSITASVIDDSITDSKLRDSSGFSVIGKSTTGTGDPADIVAGADGVLRRSGSGNLEFGTLVTNNIGNSQVTVSKIQNINSNRILGRTTAGGGIIEQLQVGQHINLSFGVLNTYGSTLIGVSVFTSSGVWNKPTGCNFAIVYVLGAGGGGGGAEGTLGQSAAGAGGGAGGAIASVIFAVGATETVTIGAPGVGGTAGNNDGSAGGTTTFGTHLGAAGGAGGSGMATGTGAAISEPGTGGVNTLSSGTVLFSSVGDSGGIGIRIANAVAASGFGGSNIFGSGSGSLVSTNGGGGGNAPGAGGAGGVSTNSASSVTGGNGGPGLVIVYEYS